MHQGPFWLIVMCFGLVLPLFCGVLMVVCVPFCYPSNVVVMSSKQLELWLLLFIGSNIRQHGPSWLVVRCFGLVLPFFAEVCWFFVYPDATPRMGSPWARNSSNCGSFWAHPALVAIPCVQGLPSPYITQLLPNLAPIFLPNMVGVQFKGGLDTRALLSHISCPWP